MRVTIFTLHNANNVGAFLQAFSLQNVIEDIFSNQGIEVSFAQFPIKKENTSKLKKVARYISKGNVFQVLYKYRTSKKYDEIRKKIKVGEKIFSEDENYEIIVLGSDEIWNVESNTFVHYPQYFGNKIKAKRIISYAPSAHNTSREILCEKRINFCNIDNISVRDGNTYELVREVDGRIPEFVCDPTLLIDSFEPYINSIEDFSDENYILVYSYGLSKSIVKEIKRYAHVKGKKLIGVGIYNAWCDKNVVVNPFEFLVWLKNADMVITSTFHGTVLSTRFHKNVVVYAEQSHKVNYFLKQMGMESRNLSIGGTLANKFDENLDYDSIDEKIKNFRVNSREWLRKAIMGGLVDD